MSTKTLSLLSYKENDIQTYIQCVISDNGSFKNKGRVLHIKSNAQLPNNEKRRKRYRLNKERKIRLQNELKIYEN